MAEAFIPGTRSARQALIAQILVKERIGSQSRLQERLREDGISVTQATLSRDLDEMGAVKVKDAEGKQVYRVPDPMEVQPPGRTRPARPVVRRGAHQRAAGGQSAGAAHTSGRGPTARLGT